MPVNAVSNAVALLGGNGSVGEAFKEKVDTQPPVSPGSTGFQPPSGVKSQLAEGNPGGVGAPSGLGISLDSGA